MQFRNPELLYALLLLIIPVLIHLFQLRKFKKEAFTNLKFLQKVSLQTRKSSQLKKWLVLCTRLLILAAIIIAFAQPFFVNSADALKEKETLVYLDNSYSMQAGGSNGKLLQRNLQELLENLPANENFTLFTNNNTYQNITLNTGRSELQQIDYTTKELDHKTLLLKAENEFSNSEETKKNFIVISDFQANNGAPDFNSAEFNVHLIKTQPQNINNISIDSAFIKTTNAEENLLVVQLSANGESFGNIPVSVYNQNQLIAKTSVDFSDSEKMKAEFSLPANTAFKGRIAVEDAGLQFDNELFFTLSKPEPINVVAISEAEDTFLKRIFTEPDFNFISFAPNEVDFAALSSANFAILNQTETIPPSITGNINQLKQNDVSLLIIPAINADMNSYNSLLRNLQLPLFQERKNQEKLITGISFSHPVYSGVFDEIVSNFEYPKVQSFYRLNNSAATVLSYEDNTPFLIQRQNNFLFTAPISNNNSNFQNSPLIVPTLFNIGKTAIRNKELFYISGRENEIDIPVKVGQDEILKISGEDVEFIPQQQSFSGKVSLITNDLPETSGNFSVFKKEEPVGHLSFNIDRKESDLSYSEIEKAKNIQVSTTIAQAFENIEADNNIDELWKWFVIFALLFLLTEMLILKFLK